MIRGTVEALDEVLITRLLEELGDGARAFRFDVAPNPCVGAALIANGQELARGFHRAYGGPHAEIDVLEVARRSGVSEADFETLVVTLEPCSSHGKTGPCVEAILAAGIKRVVVGSLDPDPRHQGQGLELLRSAGVEVWLHEGVTPLTKISPHFLEWTKRERVRRPRPWTLAKWAQTRTGQLTPPEGFGDGRTISGPEAHDEVLILRGRVDAIVTGIGTVLADDPRLTVRTPGDLTRPPARIILDSYLRTSPEARLFDAVGPNEAAGDVHIIALAGSDAPRRRALEACGAQIHGLRAGERGSVSLRGVQEWLWEQGYARVLLEAGPALLTRYLELGFVDQIRVYSSAVNGGQGPSLGPWLAQLHLGDRLDREVGGDGVLEGFVREHPF